MERDQLLKRVGLWVAKGRGSIYIYTLLECVALLCNIHIHIDILSIVSGGVTTMQVRTHLRACHMSFNKFQMLIAFQTMITAGRGLSIATLT